jgi:hypothetical protein
MTTWTRFAVASAVAVSLAAPDVSWAQARSGSSSQDSPSAGPRSAPSDSGGGSAQPRSGSASGGSGSSSQGASGGPTTRSSPGGSGGQAGPRDRGSRPSQGEAQVRTYGRPGGSAGPGYVTRSYYPWYGSSFGYYDPWYGGYGYSRWHRYPYGGGYGVFGFPFGFYDPYSPYGYSGGGSYGRSSRDDQDNERPTGAIRLRANPSHARVYVDGALVGTVDDFDGLSGHLRLEAGLHQIELRAEGYETYTNEVTVTAGRTMTERASLKRSAAN